MFRNPALHVLRTHARFQRVMLGIGLPARSAEDAAKMDKRKNDGDDTYANPHTCV